MAFIVNKFGKLDLFSKTLFGQIVKRFCNQPSNVSNNTDIDNADKVMNEVDNEIISHSNPGMPSPQEITTRNLEDNIMAPLDVNPWIDEELEKGGTIDMEYIEKEREEIHYPEPPKERSGYYEFEGIKIWLPKRMLTPATYRYRLTDEEQQTLPDDIRICKFEKFKPTS